MLLKKLDPPGLLDDFNDKQKAQWSKFIGQQLDRARKGYPDRYDFDAPRKQFYNPMKMDTGADVQTVDITWIAFPRSVTVASVSDLQRWRRADSSRDLQDEYCEWSVERDPHADKITRVTFTCEGPEYWEYLAKTTPQVALALYRKFISLNVQLKDLFLPNGRYNPQNKWNSSTANGAMHLIQPSNTLYAEIELAAGASVVRSIDGALLTGEQELIRCGEYGLETRHSDPHIGAVVNSVTRQKADVTLENPIGLYFADLNTFGWVTPDGSDPKLYWKYVRGADNKPLRAVYEVPEERGFTVGDIKIQGREIQFGGQISDFINMKLTGVGTRFGQSTVAPMTGCRTAKQAPESDFVAEEEVEMPSVQEVLGKDWVGAR